LELVEQRSKENPIKVLVKAIENASPREEVISIEYGGARYPKAVECAPQRRIDFALRLMTQGARHKTFNNPKNIVECLADEILAAYRSSQDSTAISRKLELERQADASR
jgi:small subunit ribosomal protein S7